LDFGRDKSVLFDFRKMAGFIEKFADGFRKKQPVFMGHYCQKDFSLQMIFLEI